MPALARHRVITVDLPGHGALTELGLREAVLVGGSMGANTIWAYTTQFGTDRLSAIVTVDQTPKMLNDAEWPYGYDETNVDTCFATGVPRTGHGTPLWRRGRRLVRLLRAMSGDHRITPEEIALLDDHAKQDWRPAITAIDVPILFAAGADSQFWPRRARDRGRRAQPARLRRDHRQRRARDEHRAAERLQHRPAALARDGLTAQFPRGDPG